MHCGKVQLRNHATEGSNLQCQRDKDNTFHCVQRLWASKQHTLRLPIFTCVPIGRCSVTASNGFPPFQTFTSQMLYLHITNVSDIANPHSKTCVCTSCVVRLFLCGGSPARPCRNSTLRVTVLQEGVWLVKYCGYSYLEASLPFWDVSIRANFLCTLPLSGVASMYLLSSTEQPLAFCALLSSQFLWLQSVCVIGWRLSLSTVLVMWGLEQRVPNSSQSSSGTTPDWGAQWWQSPVADPGPQDREAFQKFDSGLKTCKLALFVKSGAFRLDVLVRRPHPVVQVHTVWLLAVHTDAFSSYFLIEEFALVPGVAETDLCTLHRLRPEESLLRLGYTRSLWPLLAKGRAACGCAKGRAACGRASAIGQQVVRQAPGPPSCFWALAIATWTCR